MTDSFTASTYKRPATGLSVEDLRAWAKHEITRIALEVEKIGNCRHCMNFRDGHCDRWDAPVPKEHQSRGCDDWVIDLIPF